MAVLHHAFRCAVTPEFDRDISEFFAAWQAGDRPRLSALALDGYAKLAKRDDLHAAFYLNPEGSASSWMQAAFVSPGLAALAMLAHRFVAIPGLSASRDTNHYLLETQLPLLGWSGTDIGFLVRGHSVEAMLEGYAALAARLDQGGFRHTGGWTPGRTAQELKRRLDQMARGVSPQADATARVAWWLLKESHALSDAQAMLAEIAESDWLVMTITH
jgi:hypothetical protein